MWCFCVTHNVNEKGLFMSDELANVSDNFYALVPEQGMILLGNDIVNLRRANAIRKQGDKTLVYFSGSEPLALPASAFDEIRDQVFAVDDLDDEEDYDEEEDENG